MIKNEYLVLGCMSGTSLDGLDLALCRFILKNEGWTFSIESAKTIKYSEKWLNLLTEAPNLSSEKLIALDRKYGIFIGETINSFLVSLEFEPEFIVSHGHTVFHNPKKSYNFQLGNGNDIYSITSIPVIYDLRSLDISMGGEGAPLVPIGDKLLFSNYDACLNLGGFSNISYEKSDKTIAFDIGPANIILNEIALKLGHPFDPDGALGKLGAIHHELLSDLNAIDFYSMIGPKTLGQEWIEDSFKPILYNHSLNEKDLLRTLYEHISFQIARIINAENFKETLISGGGSHNKFLISLLQKQCHSELVIPDDILIDFKEALIFAFLGVLRLRGENNCLSSVTGAHKDCSGGVNIGF